MKISTCKHCGLKKDISVEPKGWMANHSRWCSKNPKKYTGRKAWNVGLTNETSEAVQRNSNSVSTAHKNGKYAHIDRSDWGGTKHWKDDTRQKMSDSARKSTHRRLQRNIVEYNGVKFDSSWEVRLAKKLDADNIKWTRPDPLVYVDKLGLNRHYFPDFYLPDYNLYLDPKNPQAFKVQKDKIDCLQIQYNNIVFLCSLTEIDKFCPSTGTAF